MLFTRSIFCIITLILFSSLIACLPPTTIHRSIEVQDWSKIKYYVEQKGDIESKNGYSFTPLMVATYWNYPAIVEYLCKNEAELDTKDRKGWTALMYATYYSYEKVVQILLDYGASRDLKNKAGLSAKDIATQNHLDHIVDLLNQD